MTLSQAIEKWTGTKARREHPDTRPDIFRTSDETWIASVSGNRYLPDQMEKDLISAGLRPIDTGKYDKMSGRKSYTFVKRVKKSKKKKNPNARAYQQMAYQTYSKITERIQVAADQLENIYEELLPFYEDGLKKGKSQTKITQEHFSEVEAIFERVETLFDVIPTPSDLVVVKESE